MDFLQWRIGLVLLILGAVQILVLYKLSSYSGLKKVKYVKHHLRETATKMGDLNNNPIYSKFNIARQPNRTKVNLLIIVSTSPRRSDRRSAIRGTWWKECKNIQKVTVKCVFLTDQPNPKSADGQKLIKERLNHDDLEFQNLSGGVEFGKRFLYHMVWAMQNYDFDYFMRMDDDYFFCLGRFLHELPMPMRRMYHWGYVHCIKNMVRPEESIILLSRDLIERFLSQDPLEMKGHPWADQMIALWVKDLGIPAVYTHDPRLHHDPPLMFLQNVEQTFQNVCTNFIGVHGSYPKDMSLLWKLKDKQTISSASLESFTLKCNKSQVFNWALFVDVWAYEPKRLIDNPSWNTTKQSKGGKGYGGRQDGQM